MGKHHGALVPLSTSFINKETLPLFNVPKDVKRIFSELAKFYFVFFVHNSGTCSVCVRAHTPQTHSLDSIGYVARERRNTKIDMEENFFTLPEHLRFPFLFDSFNS